MMRRCKFGWHSWYLDCGLIRSAYRCNYCSKAQNKQSASELDAERQRISNLPPNATFSDIYLAASSYPAIS